MNTQLKIFVTLMVLGIKGVSQSLINGNFALGVMGWGCGVEVNLETVYGGAMINQVVEVDALAGLCQNITGLTPGNSYSLSFDATRRTGGCPSPAVTNINISVNGVLSSVATRTNTVFGWSNSGYVFTASAATHTLSMTAGTGFGGSSCGMIIDNIRVDPNTILPIELIAFNARKRNGTVYLDWSTATEKNNNHFKIEKSSDGLHFTEVKRLPSQAPMGNSAKKLEYSAMDEGSPDATDYYRLRQVDHDGTFSLSRIVQAEPEKSTLKGFKVIPNPNSGSFRIIFADIKSNEVLQIALYDAFGKLRYFSAPEPGNTVAAVDLEHHLEPGCYYCKIIQGNADAVFSKIIVE